MATNKYSELTKDELISEIKRRRDAGGSISVDLRDPKEVLASALAMDDAEGGSPAPAADTPAKPTDGSLGNQVSAQPEMPSAATQPNADVFAKGKLAKHKGDGFVYQTVKVETDDQKPWKARVPAQESGHPGFFWEGSEKEFKETFDKV